MTWNRCAAGRQGGTEVHSHAARACHWRLCRLQRYTSPSHLSPWSHWRRLNSHKVCVRALERGLGLDVCGVGGWEGVRA